MNKKRIIVIASVMLVFLAAAFLLFSYFGDGKFSFYRKNASLIEKIDKECEKSLLNCRAAVDEIFNEKKVEKESLESACSEKIKEYQGEILKYRTEALKGVIFGDNVKAGDVFGGWKVKSVEKIQKDGPDGDCDSGDGCSDIAGCFPNNIAVAFSGQAEVIGLSECVEADNMEGSGECHTFCLQDFTVDSEVKIPRYAGDEKNTRICFSEESVKNLREWPGEQGVQYKAIISDLVLNYSSQGGVVNQASLLRLDRYGLPRDGESTGTILDTIKIGDKIKGLAVKGFSAFNGDSWIGFSGQIRITGDYYYDGEVEEGCNGAWFSNLDVASKAKMPQVYPGEKVEFCVHNSDLVKKELAAVAVSGRATIDIDSYNWVDCNCGAWSNAELVDVVSVKAAKNDCPAAFNDFSVVKNGDCYGGMTASAVKVGYMGKQEGDILFKALATGNKQLSGKYEYYDKDYAFTGGLVCFYPDNRDNLPRVKTDEREAWFCFSNQDEARKEFGPIGSSGQATIEISDYYYVVAGTEGWNGATLKKVISK